MDVAGQWFLLHLVAGSVAIWYLTGRKRPPTKPGEASGYGSHGTARFAKSEELLEYLNAKGPGLILGKQGNKYLILPNKPELRYNQNVTVIGGSGVRKTRSFVQPNILQAAAFGGESLIVIDPKAENYARSAKLLKEKGYEVYILNLLHMDESDRWNPLDAVQDVNDAADLAANLVANTVNPNRPRTGDPFWDNAEQALITALVLYIKRHRPLPEHHLASVVELGTELSAEALDEIFLHLPSGDPARRYYRSFLRAEDKVRGGVLAGLGSRLQLWNSPEVAALTAASDFGIGEFGLKPKALFLVIPDSKATYAPLLALFWQQAFEVLYRMADEQGGRLKVPVRCRMDEIANCGFIPDYEKKKSTMRSRGISTEEIWQSLGQIKSRYPGTWAELLSNSDHLLFLGTNDLETAQYISQKLGQTTIQVESQNTSSSDTSTTTGSSQTRMARPLMTVDEVLRLESDEALLIPRATYPAKVKKADFTEHPLADQIILADHRDHKPPVRKPVAMPDVQAIYRATKKRAEPGEAPALEKPRGKADTTIFLALDEEKTKVNNREEVHDQTGSAEARPAVGGDPGSGADGQRNTGTGG